jgi:hypothetical protein
MAVQPDAAAAEVPQVDVVAAVGAGHQRVAGEPRRGGGQLPHGEAVQSVVRAKLCKLHHPIEEVHGLTVRSGSSGQESPLTDADGICLRHVLPPSSFYPCLLTGRWDPRALRPVALGTGGDEVLHGGGSALGPREEVVTMLSGPRAPTPGSSFHLALAAGPRHALPALLATEAPDRVSPPDVPAVHNRRDNEQNNDQQPRKRCRSQNAVNKVAKDPTDG